MTPVVAALFRRLILAGGHWRSGEKLRRDEPQLEGVRIDRVLPKLPSALKDLVLAESGKGYCLNIDALSLPFSS